MKKLLLPLFVIVCLVNDTNTRAITVTTSAAPIIASQLSNISTRAFVQTGDNVMIGGFMVQGTEPKRVIIRAIGPELTQYGVPDPLANPTLELHDGTRALIASNDNWHVTIIGGIITSDQGVEIRQSGHAPGNPLASAIIADLPPGNYTAIVRGVNNMTGVALVEAYDLSPGTSSILANISARSFVQTGDNMMIGGFMVQGTEPKRVIIRAIGPELTQYGVPDALANPTLELHDGAGALIASNDNWQHTIIGGIITAGQVAAIQNSGHAPTAPGESAIIATLPPGDYTAIVRGKNNTTGVALVEVYDLDSQPTYDAAIQEGQTAAQELINQGASAVAIALVDDKRIIWSQGFGLADRDTGQVPTNTTMFGVGSVSKMFAAIAVMQLVDRGVVDLDTPLVTYLPAFRMVSPGYGNITVRMLLNHSSGFPGTDYRNADIRSPVPGYVNQVLQTLSMSRLKDPPGYMSVYCNDGFTITAALVEAMTGKSYVQFVHDEILTPLGMANTRYPLSAFPTGSYAKAYVNGAVKPQEFVNTLAAGAAYSTADDLAHIAMMFLSGGRVGTTRVLSGTAVAEMAVDQTIGSFDPIHNDSLAFGLGWDSVSQPGLAAVGFDGWAKGGDSNDYGAAIVVSPQAQLGTVVLAASFGGSARAIVIAERVLLRALYENGRIAAFPSPILPVVPPVAPVPDGLLAAIAGEYAQGNLIVQLQAQPDGSLQASVRSDGGWTPIPPGSPLKYRDDGWFASDQDPLKAFKVVDADLLGVPTQYIVNRAPAGYGHYLDYSVFAQRVRRRPGNLSAAWQARLSSTWLVVNENPAELAWNGMDPRLRLAAVPNLDGLIAVRPPSDVPAPAAGHTDTRFHIVDASASDTVATMMLIIPQLNGRDLDDLDIVERDGAEWTRFGSYMHQPLASVPVLPRGATDVITIGPEGYAEWRAVASDVTPVQVTITTTGAWHLYDPAFTSLANGKGSAVTSLPAGNELGYLTLFGYPGQTITVAVQ